MYLMCDDLKIAKLVHEGIEPFMELLVWYDDFYNIPFGLFCVEGDPFTLVKRIPYERFNNWLCKRCFPRNRIDCKDVLKTLGLKEYNPVRITYITQGVLTCFDMFWVDFEDGRGKPKTF